MIGAIPGSPVVGTAPANVTVNDTGGGVTYFGTNSISASAPNNTLNATGANIVFNTGSLPASAISLGGGVTITADPPVVNMSSQSSNVSSPISSHNASALTGQSLGQNASYVNMNNAALIAEPVSAANNTVIGITNAAVQLLNSNAAAEILLLIERANQASSEHLNSR